VDEPGSAWVRSLITERANTAILSEIAIVDEAADLAQVRPLKGYDAMHMATGLQAARDLADQEIVLVFVSGDDQMLRAAEAEVLMTDNPFSHVDMDRV